MLVQRSLDVFFKKGGDFQTRDGTFTGRKEGQECAGSYQFSMLAVVMLLASPKGACSLFAYVQARANKNWGEYAI